MAHVLHDPDPVLAARTATVPDLEVRELTLRGVGRERGQPVSLNVIETQLRAGMRALTPHDDSHPVWPVVVEVE